MFHVIVYILIGFSAGLLSGFFGVGGGIIIVPALVLVLGYSQHLAQGTSLTVLLLPIGIFAVYEYYKVGNVEIKAATFIVCFLYIIAHLITYRVHCRSREKTFLKSNKI